VAAPGVGKSGRLEEEAATAWAGGAASGRRGLAARRAGGADWPRGERAAARRAEGAGVAVRSRCEGQEAAPPGGGLLLAAPPLHGAMAGFYSRRLSLREKEWEAEGRAQEDTKLTWGARPPPPLFSPPEATDRRGDEIAQDSGRGRSQRSGQRCPSVGRLQSILLVSHYFSLLHCFGS
jgi:hypothetical protein